MSDTTAPQGHGTRGATTTATPEEARSSILGAIKDAIRSTTHLQVVTMVGDARIGTSEKTGLDLVTVTVPDGVTVKVMATNIDIALGDASQVVSPELLTDDQKAVRDMHDAMVAQAQATVAANLKLLGELLKDLFGRTA